MCRVLAVAAREPFLIADYLASFAELARSSPEYQGHGWGCSWMEDGQWRTHHQVTPIWDTPPPALGRTTVLLAHARSAFRNEGVTVENNMPFVIGQAAFSFNGELRGVRIAEAGRIGADKLFRFLLRHGADAGRDRFLAAIGTVHSRTRYVRALNAVLAVPGRFLIATSFAENPDYFTLHVLRTANRVVISSCPLDPTPDWVTLPNGAVEEVSWLS